MRQELSLPWVVCEYEDVFLDDLLGLPPHRDVDFIIELHPGTSVRPEKFQFLEKGKNRNFG